MIRVSRWRRGIFFRSTASVLVGSLLVGPQALGFGSPPALRSPPPSGGPTRAATPSPAPPAEEVPGRLLPAKVAFGAGVPWAFDPNVLFDGDAATQLPAATDAPMEIRIALAGARQVDGLRIWGAPGGTFSARAELQGKSAPISGLVDRQVAGAADRWNRLDASAPVRADVVVLEWRAAPVGAHLDEIEIWGAVPLSPNLPEATLPDQLVGGLPPGAAVIAAEPKEIAVVGDKASTLEWNGTASFQLDRDPARLGRAFLVYELEGLERFTEAIRSINGLPPRGGALPVLRRVAGAQVEEISPRWLRAGRNEIHFLPVVASFVAGYKVRNLRLVTVAEDGRATPTIESASRDLAAIDGMVETAVRARPARGGLESDGLDLSFGRATQPQELAFHLPAPFRGTLVASAAGGKAGGRATVDLQRLVPGWHRIPLDRTLPPTDGVHVALRAAGEAVGTISEIRVAGSPLPVGRPQVLTLAFPLHGECIEHRAYLRGFTARPPHDAVLKVNGRPQPDALGHDGAFELIVPESGNAPAPGKPWSIDLTIADAGGARASRKVPIDACVDGARGEAVAGNPSIPTDGLREDRGAPYRVLVRAGEAKTLAFGGATLDIPAGAVDKDTQVTIRPLLEAQLAPVDQTMSNVMPERKGYRFGPHGLTFKKPVRITLPYQRDLLPPGMEDGDVFAFYYDEGETRWRTVARIETPRRGKVASITTHFTDFITSTLAVPDHPTAQSFNPNTMKDIKLADPAAGIDLIAPPDPSSDGAAHLSYPIKVPPGRHGLQPSLGLTYSSETSNGWLGVGWDLAVSSIQIDTSFGVPNYDGNDVYLLDGQMLTTTDGRFYARRVEGRFDRIERFGSAADSHFFVVTDKTGTQFVYGQSAAARLANPGPVKNTVRWYLERVQDTFGNTINYQYRQASGVTPGPGGGLPWVQTYLSQIDYTGHVGTPALDPRYHVRFTSNEGRRDVMSTARARFDVRTRERLDQIDVLFDNQIVRSYKLGYNDGASVASSLGKTLLLSVSVSGLGGFDANKPDQGRIAEHTFDYVPMDVGADGAVAGFAAPAPWANLGGSGLTDGEDGEGGFNAFAGVGPTTCYPHAGGGASVSVGGDNTNRQFADINGDGLPDLVSDDGNALLNGFASQDRTAGSFSPRSYGFTTALASSSRVNLGVQIAGHGFGELGSAGAYFSWNFSSEHSALIDFDGDGWPDLVSGDGSSVVLNKDGSFQPLSTSGALTPAAASKQLADDLPDQQTRDDFNNQLHPTSPLIRWTAPFAGHVIVSGGALVDATPAGADPGDGVVATVSKAAIEGTRVVTRELWNHAIAPGGSPCGPAASNGCGSGLLVHVRLGDRLYFRVDPGAGIRGDTTRWSPTVAFRDLCLTPTTDPRLCPPLSDTELARLDAFDLPLYRYSLDPTDGNGDGKPDGDFRLPDGLAPGWTAHADGTVTITADLVRQKAGDPFTVRVLRNQVAVASANIGGAVGTTPISWTVDVLSGDQLLFLGNFSAQKVDTLWIGWRPRVAYSLICGADGVTLQSTCRHVTTCTQSGNQRVCELETFPGETEIQTVPESKVVALSEIRDQNAPGVSAPNFTTFDVPSNGRLELASTLFKESTQESVQLLVQSTRQRLFARSIDRAAIPEASAISIPDPASEPRVFFDVVTGDKLTFLVKGNSLFDLFDIRTGEPRVTWKPTLGYVGSGSSDPVTVNLAVDEQDPTQSRLSGGFRGWSYAEWNSSVVFDESGLNPTDRNNVPFNALSPHTDNLVRKLPEGDQRVPGPLFIGRGVDFFLTAGSMKPSSIGGIDAQRVGNAPGLRRSRGMVSELGVSLVASFSKTKGDSTGELDFIDLNGDRRPDSISDNQAQFSTGAGYGAAKGLGLADSDPRRIETLGTRFGVSFGSGASALAEKLGAGGGVKAAVSLLPSLGQNYGVSSTKVDFIDVNGDGLPDHVSATSPTRLTVQINLGGEFGPETFLDLGDSAAIEAFKGSTLADIVKVGLPALDTAAVRAQDNTTNNLQIGYAGIGGGIAYSVNRTLIDFIDVNGDGLPDRVAKQPGQNVLRVKLNLGDRFDEETQWSLPGWGDVQLEKSVTKPINGGNDALSFSETGTVNVGIGAAIPITFAFGCLMLEIGETIGIGNNSAELGFDDVDGDGKVDHVLKLSDGLFRPDRADLRAKLNRVGKTNLLRKVTRPLGGSFDIDYKREGNAVRRDMTPKVDMPRSQWVLASVSVSDGMQTPPYVRTFDYAADGQSPTATVKVGSGFFDRDEREDYGYAHVTETREDQSVVEHFFHTEDFYRKGLERRRVEKDRDGMLFTVEEMTYDDPSGRGLPVRTGSFFPGMLTHEVSTYEGVTADPARPIRTRVETHTYTNRGDVRTMALSDPLDGTKVVYTVGYYEDPALSVVRPNDVTATSGSTLLRKRGATYNPTTGALETLTDSVFGGKDPETGLPRTGTGTPATTIITYDPFGNLETYTDPNGARDTYAYDDTLHAFRVSATDAFGLSSTSTPNFLFGVPDDMTDINNQKQVFKYDDFGRVVRIYGPKDPPTGDPTIEFAYGTQPGATPVPAWGQTRHKDVLRPGDPIDTVTFIDGIGRLLQTKKDLEKDLGSGTRTAIGMSISGRVQFDERGRVVKQGQPIFSTAAATQFLPFDIGPNITTYSFDILGRVTSVVAPDGATTRTFYASATLDGKPFLAATTLDPNLKQRITYRDAYERIVAVHEKNTIGGAMKELITRYSYDPLDELIGVRDPKENVTTAIYDSAGQMVVLDNPDVGRTEYRYDVGGNMLVKETPNLRARGQLIRYRFDRNRLLRIDYPTSTPVIYTYGERGAPFGRAGRVTTQSDESGTQELSYGALGEIVQTAKTFASHPPTPEYKATTLISYDSFGRMLDLTYPDGEKVTYTYDAGGSVKALAGRKADRDYVYVTHLGYDEFEQRARLIHGNGVETRYSYDPRSRRLTDVNADLPGATPLQRLHYGYDPAGNLTTLANNVPVPPSNQKGGPTSFTFDYDDLYQLKHATGSYRFPPGKERKFTFATNYDEIGNTQRKTQADAIFQSSGSGAEQKPTSYDYAYEYAGPRPHATTHVGTQTYSYDANGNQTGWTDDRNGQRRDLTWNEENRLTSLSDDGHTSTFLYDASGTRSHKRVETGQTIYVNQFYSIKNGEVATKHFFAGETRVASKPDQTSGRGTPDEKVIYFFHPDHLGSSNYVTDQRARIFQHDEYFPSGETWVEESSTTDRTPYLFTGKELDETGLYDFGARYYDPRTSAWTTADPILASYMKGGPSGGVLMPRNLNLYSHAWNNPVVLRDPNGLCTATGYPGECKESHLKQLQANIAEPELQAAAFRAALPAAVLEGVGEGYATNLAVIYGVLKAERGLAPTSRELGSIWNNILVSKFGEKAIAGRVMTDVSDWYPAALEAFGMVLTAGEFAFAVRLASSAGALTRMGAAAAGGGAAAGGLSTAEMIGILRDATKGKGNFGLGTGSRAEAQVLGEAWVGPGARLASDGKTLLSADGMRQFRPPSFKPDLGKVQANFERRIPGQTQARWQGNGHLDIND